MGDLRYKDPATGLWESIPLEGPVGATGPPGPVGPPSGGVNVVGWAFDAEQTTGAANTLTLILSTTVHIKPDSFYELAVGWRCVSDFGAAGLLQYEVKLNDVAVPTHSVLSTNGDSGLDLAHYRAWIRKGDWAVDVEGDYTFQLMIMTSVASRIIYSPEISVVELNDPNAPTGGGGPIALDDLTDVSATGPTDGQVLTYDDTLAQWVPGTGGNHGRVEFRTTRAGWHRIATFRGAGSADISLTQAGRNEGAQRSFTLSWTGERMQLSMQGSPQYGNYLPNYALHTTGLYGEQYLDIETTAGSAAVTVEAEWSVSDMESDPGAVFQPAGFTLSATEIATPGGTATPWPAVAGGSAPSLALDDLTDVDLTMIPSDGDTLVYNTSSGQWLAEAPATGGGAGGGNVEFDTLGNVSHPANGSVAGSVAEDRSIALGIGANANVQGSSYGSSVAIGQGSQANAGYAIGLNAFASADGVAIGTDTSAAQGVALGTGATIEVTTGEGGCAIGKNAVAGDGNAIALGNGASAVTNSVAIGGGVQATVANEIRLGAAGHTVRCAALEVNGVPVVLQSDYDALLARVEALEAR